MEITKTYYAKDRNSWRTGLEKNHKSKKEIWLVYYKKNSNKSRVEYSDAVKEALCFGWIDSTAKSIDEEKYAQRFTPRRKGSKWSSLNVKYYKELEKLGLVSDEGKKAFAVKVDGPTFSKKINYSWHRKNLMKKNPSKDERIAWHREHVKNCECRPFPKSLG